eukprot:SAG22_NODE_4289_length_1316_cov_1.156943_1_plen_286_part_01
MAAAPPSGGVGGGSRTAYLYGAHKYTDWLGTQSQVLPAVDVTQSVADATQHLARFHEQELASTSSICASYGQHEVADELPDYDGNVSIVEQIEQRIDAKTERRTGVPAEYRLRSADARVRRSQQAGLVAAEQQRAAAVLQVSAQKSDTQLLGKQPAQGVSALPGAKRLGPSQSLAHVHPITGLSGEMKLGDPGVPGCKLRPGTLTSQPLFSLADAAATHPTTVVTNESAGGGGGAVMCQTDRPWARTPTPYFEVVFEQLPAGTTAVRSLCLSVCVCVCVCVSLSVC